MVSFLQPKKEEKEKTPEEKPKPKPKGAPPEFVETFKDTVSASDFLNAWSCCFGNRTTSLGVFCTAPFENLGKIT